MSKLNWASARLVQPDHERQALQKYHQERNGDELTKAIKVAKRHQRKQHWEELQ